MSARRAEARRDDPIPQSLFTVGPRRAIPRRWTRVTVVLLALALAVLAHAQEPGQAPSVPEPVGFVNDHAGKLDESTRARLEAFLDQLKQKTGAEFAVLIVPTTAPMSPSEYKVEVFRRWGLGRKGEDDGLLMLVALEEREVRFETGYGLEGTLPDGLQSRIFRNEMAPRFREDDWAGGVTAGVLACAARIAAEKGVTLEWDGRELRYRAAERGLPPMVLGLIIAIVVLFVVMRVIGGGGGVGRGRGRRRGWYLGPGSFGGFGGGFGGGSFGGFGGGASGGGGGGGRW